MSLDEACHSLEVGAPCAVGSPDLTKLRLGLVGYFGASTFFSAIEPVVDEAEN